MHMEVYWVEVEYEPQDGCELANKPGVVYAFLETKDAISAYYEVNKALLQRKLNPTRWLFMEPYEEMHLSWDSDEEKAHFGHLCEQAKLNGECVFDKFYDFDEL